MWVCLLYLWLLSHVLTWGILLFWFVFLKAVSQFFHLRTKGLMSVNGYGGDWITGPLRVVSSNWWIFEHIKSLWLLVFSVIEGGLFSCRHSMMSKVLERIQYFNLAFFFFSWKRTALFLHGICRSNLGSPWCFPGPKREAHEKVLKGWAELGLTCADFFSYSCPCDSCQSSSGILVFLLYNMWECRVHTPHHHRQGLSL